MSDGDGTWSVAGDLLTALADGVADVSVLSADGAENVGLDATTSEWVI